MSNPEKNDPQSAYQHALEIKRTYEPRLMAYSNVVGVGLGLQIDTIVLVVLVNEPVNPDLPPEECLPKEIEGLPVDIRVIGDVQAL